MIEKTSVLVALFAALIAVLGLVPAFPLASGVPITAQSLGIMLCGTILGSRKGGLAALFFVLLTLVGLPLLAGGRGGIGLLAGASAGFIVGFPIAAYITGWLMEKTKSVDILISVPLSSIMGGIVILYIPGLIGMMINAGMSLNAAIVAVSVYLPGDILKVILATIVTSAIFKARPNSVLTRTKDFNIIAEPIPPAAAIAAIPDAPGFLISSLNKRITSIAPEAPIG